MRLRVHSLGDLLAQTRAEGDCLLWTGSVSNRGYGRYGSRYAHRMSVEFSGRTIPAGWQVDHLCRTPLCVNPKHLEPVDPRTNLLRGVHPSAQFHRGTCKRGHDVSSPNEIYVAPDGHRMCRQCNALRNREWQRKAKLNTDAPQPCPDCR